MKPEWKQLAAADDFAIERGAIVVEFASTRTHRVEIIDEDAETWRFRAIVAKPAALAQLGDRELLPWRLNRASTLVGYRYDQHGRLVGEAWVPRAVEAEEFQLVVRLLAAECDRLELRITGNDEH